jgi:hypothetical protein
MAGDYDRFSRSMEHDARSFYERLDVPPGAHLLDVACGSGQLALIAAREGVRVAGVDIAENLIERPLDGRGTPRAFPGRRRGIASLPGVGLRRCRDSVRRDVCAASATGGEATHARLYSRRNHRHGQLDGRRVYWKDVQHDRKLHRSFGDALTTAMGR